MKIRNLIILLSLILTLFSLSMAQTDERTISGTVKDKAGIARTGITLYFEAGEKRRSVSADIDGNFKIALPPGKYTVVPDKNIYLPYTLFVEIPVKGLLPTNISFEVESRKDWCSNCRADRQPDVVSYKILPYPSIAKQVGAAGEVAVNVKIKSDGSVLTATALSGHPLLKNVAAQAARGWVFSKDDSIEERDAIIVFAFAGEFVKGKSQPGYNKPNRVEVFYLPNFIY